MSACNPVWFSLESIKGNLHTYLLTYLVKRLAQHGIINAFSLPDVSWWRFLKIRRQTRAGLTYLSWVCTVLVGPPQFFTVKKLLTFFSRQTVPIATMRLLVYYQAAGKPSLWHSISIQLEPFSLVFRCPYNICVLCCWQKSCSAGVVCFCHTSFSPFILPAVMSEIISFFGGFCEIMIKNCACQTKKHIQESCLAPKTVCPPLV